MMINTKNVKVRVSDWETIYLLLPLVLFAFKNI